MQASALRKIAINVALTVAVILGLAWSSAAGPAQAAKAMGPKAPMAGTVKGGSPSPKRMGERAPTTGTLKPVCRNHRHCRGLGHVR